MAVDGEVAALRVADEAFLISSTIDRCPKSMMIRELIMNAVESARYSAEEPGLIEIKSKQIGKFTKLSIWNNGPGMSNTELHEMCDIASSIGKDKGLDDNFGMGAKVASLPSNRIGLRYRSCKNGIVSEVIICERGGIYGRLKRIAEDGNYSEVFDVTEGCKQDGYNIAYDWTEVTLFGNREEQNTVKDPYDQNPSVNKQWLSDYLYHRFFRIPKNVTIKMFPGTHKLDGTRTFRTIPDRAFPIGTFETVNTAGLQIHYFYDPPYGQTAHNASLSGSMSTDVSLCSVVFKDEMYDIRRGRQWKSDAPIFGITFGAQNISIHIEIDDSYPVRPEAYRQFLRYRERSQEQVLATDFSAVVRENRPAWLIDIISSFAPADEGNSSEIRDELQSLLDRLRIRSESIKQDTNGEIPAETTVSDGTEEASEGVFSAKVGRSSSNDLFALPSGSKRASNSIDFQKVPEIIPLYNERDIEEKEIKGKAARFYSDSNSLFVNMNYYAVQDMQNQLEREYAGANDVEAMRKLALELSRKTMMRRVGRAVVYTLAKKIDSSWTREDMVRAQSPETLSLAADDFIDSMQNVRRKMGQVLRTFRQEVEE